MVRAEIWPSPGWNIYKSERISNNNNWDQVDRSRVDLLRKVKGYVQVKNNTLDVTIWQCVYG